MHVPDGFISPKVYLPATAAAAGLWAYALSRARRALHEGTVPMVAVLTAFAFVLMTISIPVPGGTTAHASGVAILAVVCGVWTTFLCVSLVLLLQALLLGTGGVTALAVNAIAMGLAGGGLAVVVFRLVRAGSRRVALFAAGWVSVVVPAALVAVVLGLQPRIASAADGAPLFFPFGVSVTLPAVVVPHALVGMAEGALTVAAYALIERTGRARA